MPLNIYPKEKLLLRLAEAERGDALSGQVYEAAAEIVADVERRGDAAVREWTARLDGVASGPSSRTIPAVFGPDAMARAWHSLPAEDARALSAAAEQIKLFHRRSLEAAGPARSWREPSPAGDGSRWGQDMRPISRVGIYVPGGRNPYPSTVLMTALPARVAGVDFIAAATPPGTDGGVHPLVLAAAHAAGVDLIVGAGGPQAIASLAFGTETVPRCDKIVGPGNAYVTAAKKIVFGRVGIDGLMGPSELLIIADEWADPRWLAADMMAQAEHGPDSPVWLITDDARLAAAVKAEMAAVRNRGSKGSREPFRRGGAVVVASLEEAVETANALAPEHVQLNVTDPEELLPLITNAGAVYIGPWAPTALGDYAAGPSHVLPTGGTARFAGGLGVGQFLRSGTIYAGSRESFRRLAPAALHLARREGFTYHARSLAIRLQADKGEVSAPVAPPGPSDHGASVQDGARGAALHLNESWQPLPQEILKDIHRRWQRLPLHRYPPYHGRDLAHRLEEEYGFPPGSVILGAGADEILQMLALAARGRVSKAVMLEPDFGQYRQTAMLAGLPVMEVPFEPGAQKMPLEAIRKTLEEGPGPVLMFLSRPNNPTGCLWALEEIGSAADAMPPGSLLVLDEAYWEFAGTSGAPWAHRRDDVAVVRTFSKALGLAGLRCGFASVPAPWRARLEEVCMPFNVSAPALMAADAVLSHRTLLEARARETTRRRDEAAAGLASLEGLTVFPSAANFFLAAVEGGAEAAGSLAEELARRGLLVRTFSHPKSLTGCLRITMGSPEEMDRLKAALKELLPWNGFSEPGEQKGRLANG